MRNERSYWRGNGRLQSLADLLNELIPFEGPVCEPDKNPALERFRIASNAYYDLFNNGGGNRRSDVGRFFPGAISYVRGDRYERAQNITEPVMDKIIAQAAIEQRILEKVA